MPNLDVPHGFRTLGRTLSGGPPTVHSYQKDAAQATALFRNDLATLETDNFLAPGGTPGTTRYQGANLHYGAALTLSDHLLIVSPDALFEAQDDDAGGTGIVAADLGLKCNAIFGAGNVATELSGHEIDYSTRATTATLDLHLVELYKNSTNAFGPNARIVVKISKHQFNPEVAGV